MWSVNIATLAIVMVIALILILAKIFTRFRRKARQAGYGSLGEYLRSTPRSDEEKRDAVDLSLKGLVICIIGLVFPPFLLIGIIPLFYGARKLAYSAMGFGLYDDPEPPNR